MRDHEYLPSMNPPDQGECVRCGLSAGVHALPGAHRRPDTGHVDIYPGVPPGWWLLSFLLIGLAFWAAIIFAVMRWLA